MGGWGIVAEEHTKKGFDGFFHGACFFIRLEWFPRIYHFCEHGVFFFYIAVSLFCRHEVLKGVLSGDDSFMRDELHGFMRDER